MYDTTDDWSLSLLLPSAALLLGGAVVYITQSQHDAIDFDAQDNSPFPPERWLQQQKEGVQTWFGSRLQKMSLPGKEREGGDK